MHHPYTSETSSAVSPENIRPFLSPAWFHATPPPNPLSSIARTPLLLTLPQSDASLVGILALLSASFYSQTVPVS